MTEYRSGPVPDFRLVTDLQELVEARKTVLNIRNTALTISKYSTNSILVEYSGGREALAFQADMKHIYDLAEHWFGKLDDALESERQSSEYGVYIPSCLDSIIRIGIERMTPEEKDRALNEVKMEIEGLVDNNMRFPDGLYDIQKILYEDRLKRNREGSR